MRRFLIFAGMALTACSRPKSRPAGVAPAAATPGGWMAPVLRLKYPYSLVEGGVATPQEFIQVRSSSALLAEHYGDIGLRVQSASLPKGHVAVRIVAALSVDLLDSARKGEAVLTDGTNLIRGRCGNRLSEPVASHLFQRRRWRLSGSLVDSRAIYLAHSRNAGA